MSDFTMLNRIERVPELNRCSAKAIALWSMLHHALDRRGRVVLGGVDYKSVLVRRLAVDSADRQWFYAALRELETAEAFVVEGDVFQLVGHAGAGLGELPKKPRGKRPSPDLQPTSTVPTSDLLPTSVGPSPDLQPTSVRPPSDLSSASARNDETHDRQSREEKKREDKSREEGDGGSASPPSPSPLSPPKAKRRPDPAELEAEVEALVAGLPPPLVASVREELVGKSGAKLTAVGWRNAMREIREVAARHGVDANQAIADSMQTYVTRYAGERPVAYLVGIVRGWTAPKPGAVPRGNRGPARPATHEEFAKAWDPKFDDPDLIDWGTRKAAANA